MIMPKSGKPDLGAGVSKGRRLEHPSRPFAFRKKLLRMRGRDGEQ